MSFTIGSLFDGSGGFPLSAFMCGGVPVWASEIEPYPIAVTKSRFPYMKHLGSVTDIKGNEVDPVDVACFGAPCQDLSVAGLRKGLRHGDLGDEETTRSGLFMDAVRIIKEMREATNGEYPRFAIYENVPGAFSSSKGEDFRIVLEELIKIVEPSAVMPAVPKNGWPYSDSYCGDGWSLAYRVFDAQYWGVPQRRRRIYLVLDLGGQCAGEILFKRDGLRGYFTEGRTPWQGIAGDVADCSGAADCEGVGLDIYNLAVTGDVAASLTTATGQGASNTGPSVAIPVVAIDQQGGKGGANYAVDVMPTICSDSHGTPHAVAYPDLILDDQGGSQISVRQDGKRPTLRAEMHGNIPAVMEPMAFDDYNFQPTGEQTCTLRAGASGGACGVTVCYDARGNGDGTIVPTITGDHNNRVTDYTTIVVGVDSYNLCTTGDVARTLAATRADNEHLPCVLLEEPVVYNGENITHPLNKTNPQPGDPCHTLGTDSRNYVVCCIDGDKIGKAERAGGSGLGIREGDKMYTLTAKDAGTHSVCVPIHDQATRFSGKRGDKSDGKGNGLGIGNPGDPMNTITAGDRHAVAFQTYQKVTGPLMANSHPGSYTGQDAFSDMLVAGKEETPVVLDRAFYNQGVNAQYDPQLYEDGTCPTLVAKGPAAVCVRYIVRRLTPTECARLQGFPDKWGHPDKKAEFTDEEYEFWLNVRNTHAEINGKATKDYTRDQMLTWYNKLHTDSSEYKMWGNGIALPCALYVMQGIAEAMQ